MEQKKAKRFFSRYVNIFFDSRINKEIKSKLFTIYFLRAFALGQEVIDKALNDIFNKSSSKNKEYYSFNKGNLKQEDDIPSIFSQYKNGNKPLSDTLISACSAHKNSSNVKSRIKEFLKDNISIKRQNLVINKIQELLKELNLSNETLLEFDQLIQKSKLSDYFRDTFQNIIEAESQYKSKKIEETIKDNPESLEKNIEAINPSSDLKLKYYEYIFSEELLDILTSPNSYDKKNECLSKLWLKIVKFIEDEKVQAGEMELTPLIGGIVAGVGGISSLVSCGAGIGSAIGVMGLNMALNKKRKNIKFDIKQIKTIKDKLEAKFITELTTNDDYEDLFDI